METADRSSKSNNAAKSESRQRKQAKPQPIPEMFKRIRLALEPYPKAMLFELRDRGFSTVYDQLCACILSIRTLDEVSLPASLKLLKVAPTPAQLLKLETEVIAELIKPVTFSFQKAASLVKIAHIAVERYGGELPCDFVALTDLPGVGPKCANLVLGIACGRKAIGVDIHVHRITNRWGYVSASTPEKTLAELEKKLPVDHWLEINELLVPFGKHICTGRLPRCSTCPVLENCEQVGVTKHL